MQKHNELIDQLQQVKNDQQIKDFIINFIDILGLDYFLLGISFPLSIIKSDIFTIDNYPEGWQKIYEEQQLIQTDPVVNYCAKNHSPIFWDQVDSEQVKIIKEALFSAPQAGFTVPLHGSMGAFGMFSLSTSSEDDTSKKVLSHALTVTQLIIPALQDAIIRVRKSQKKQKVQLTTREIECLTWATEGKSAWEISKILGCSERTITFHLKNATVKLNCANRYQAIGKAIITGVISPKL
tara:strand:- start:2772 stop:3485 length:714 start_codon:yes stop_codon:yes gene_type:complete